MRFIILLVVLILSSCASKTTVDCYNRQSKKELTKGFPNILIVVSNKKVINVTIDKGSIEKTENNNYSVIPQDDYISKITVHLRNKSEEFDFKIKKLAPSVLTFGGEVFEETDSISARRFRVTRPGIIVSPDFVCNDFSLDITNMKIIRIDKNNAITSELVTENYSELVRLAEFGDTYIFTDVEYKFPSISTIFHCPTTIIKIKN